MDNKFNFQLKTKLYFGKNQEDEIGNILKQYNASKVLIVYGQGSVIKSGLLGKITNILNQYGINYFCLSGIRPNPTIEDVNKGLSLVKEKSLDFILAIGGGSVMDTAKLIANAYYYEGNPFDLSIKKYISQNALPFGVICTIAASGSEMSNSCVIQDDNLGIKSGYSSDFNRPLFAICNPELTYTVSPYQTAVGIVDIMMHTLERYFSDSSYLEPCDSLAIGLLKEVIKAAEVVMKNPCDYEARASLMLLSSFSHNGITSIGKKYIMPVHQLEHALSATYVNVAHGAGLAVLFPAWCKAYIDIETNKLATLGKELFNPNLKSDKDNAIMCISAFENFFKKLKMPLSFADLGIENPNIDLLVERFSLKGTRVIDHKVKPLDQKVAEEIYLLAK